MNPPCALLTDFYELSMLRAYFREGLEGAAVFELFVRALPPGRDFLLAAGLEQALDYLEGLRFSGAELEWVSGRFDADFARRLSGLRFRGDVHALPEGTVFFPDEPLLRVSASLPEAQLVETRLLNILHFQTVVASKAARCVLAAGGRSLVDFGLRRAHGGEAGLWAARAAYLAGFDATSAVEAGRRFGIPLAGTMAHSYVQAHEDEEQAFAAFAGANPGEGSCLLDTYDVDGAAAAAARVAARLRDVGAPLRSVRLDSGDMAAQAVRVRRILDEAGLSAVRILASGNLDERAIQALACAPIDGYGVGTRVVTSADAPYLDCAYKLQEYEGRPRRKRSMGKETWPGRKQVWRELDGGRLAGDVVALEGEAAAGSPLLEPVMRGGRRLARPPALEDARTRARAQLDALPAPLRGLVPAPAYPVRISDGVRALAARLDAERRAAARTGS